MDSADPTPSQERCRLCHSETEAFFEPQFIRCLHCGGILRKTYYLPDAKKEKSRYDLHQNNTKDSGYIEFVAPITQYITENFSAKASVLDFGSGPSSAVLKILKEQSYSIIPFDPFYHPNTSILNNTFDFVVACEVIEHFHFPDTMFRQLKKMLNPGGELLLMTHLWDNALDFEKWYYKNDFTHVFFYTSSTMEWIKSHYGFSELHIQNRFIRLKN